jgi:WD40 repeat protein
MQKLGPPLHHHGLIGKAMFNRDESRILTFDGGGTAQLWDARTGQKLGPPVEHKESIEAAAFNPNESLILTKTFYGPVQFWLIDADLDFPADAVELWIEASTATEFDPAGWGWWNGKDAAR